MKHGEGGSSPGCGAFFAASPDSIFKQPTLRRPAWSVARGPPLSVVPPKKRGEERWTALARMRTRPVARLAIRSVPGSGTPATHGGRRAFRRSIAAFSLRRRAALSSSRESCPDRQPAPGRRPSVPPGGARRRPGAWLANHARGRRTSQGPELPGAGCRSFEANLLPDLRPAPPSRRLMSAPLSEQGDAKDKVVLGACVVVRSRCVNAVLGTAGGGGGRACARSSIRKQRRIA